MSAEDDINRHGHHWVLVPRENLKDWRTPQGKLLWACPCGEFKWTNCAEWEKAKAAGMEQDERQAYVKELVRIRKQP